MGNLEEAFVNIGLNPESFIRPNQDKHDKEVVLEENNSMKIRAIPPPECYFNSS